MTPIDEFTAGQRHERYLFMNSLKPGDIVEYDFGDGIVIVTVTGDCTASSCVGMTIYTEDKFFEAGHKLLILPMTEWVRWEWS